MNTRLIFIFISIFFAMIPTQILSAQTVHFGMLSIAANEVVRLHAVAVQPIVVSDTVPPGPCRVSLGFRDSNGNSLAQPSSFILTPAHAASLDFVVPLRMTGLDRYGRMKIHPTLRVLLNLTGEAPCQGVKGSLEVFDSITGKSSGLSFDPNRFSIEDPDL